MQQPENAVYYQTSSTDYQTTLTLAIEEQELIGWHNATRRVHREITDSWDRTGIPESIEQGTAQQHGYSFHSMTTALTTPKQMTNLLWSGRNQALHHQQTQ